MMPKTLYDTTLDPDKRRLLRVTIPEGDRLETEQVITDLMGKDPATRFREITAGWTLLRTLTFEAVRKHVHWLIPLVGRVGLVLYRRELLV